jgi:hypothetical protein
MICQSPSGRSVYSSSDVVFYFVINIESKMLKDCWYAPHYILRKVDSDFIKSIACDIVDYSKSWVSAEILEATKKFQEEYPG